MPFLSSFLCVRPLQYFKNGAKNAPGRPALLFEFGTFCGGGQAKIMPHIFSAGIVLTALPEYVRLHNPPGACKFPSKWCIYMRFLHALRSSCVFVDEIRFPFGANDKCSGKALGIWTALANGCMPSHLLSLACPRHSGTLFCPMTHRRRFLAFLSSAPAMA